MLKTEINLPLIGPDQPKLPGFSASQYCLIWLSFLVGGLVVSSFLLDLVGLPVKIWSSGPLTTLLIGGVAVYSRRRIRKSILSFPPRKKRIYQIFPGTSFKTPQIELDKHQGYTPDPGLLKLVPGKI